MSLLLLIMIIFSFVVSVRSVVSERKHKKSPVKADKQRYGEF